MTSLRWGMWIKEGGNRVKWMNIDTDEMVQKLYPYIDVDDLDGMLVQIDTMMRNLDKLEFEDETELELDIVRDGNFYATVSIENAEGFKEFKRDLMNSLESWWDFINEILDDEE